MKHYGESHHRPYQCFMGQWEGLCKTFDPGGTFVESTLVRMDVYWVDETTWHLHEYFAHLYQAGETTFHTDIKVEGKRCVARSDMITLEGTELTPFNYVFMMESAVTQSTVINNHYFLDPNTRRIITHKLRGGKTHCFQIQDFTRIVQP